VQAILTDIDTGSTTLPYYNATNPSQPFSGPANSGMSQFTVRSVVCTIGLKAGIAASNDRHLTVACTVRDVSATGARLRVGSSVGIPDTFELIIEVDGLEADCQVVWRKADEVGVRFLAAPRIVAAKRAQVINPLTPAKAPSLRRTPALPPSRT
jgi:hypothetical protein